MSQRFQHQIMYELKGNSGDYSYHHIWSVRTYEKEEDANRDRDILNKKLRLLEAKLQQKDWTKISYESSPWDIHWAGHYIDEYDNPQELIRILGVKAKPDESDPVDSWSYWDPVKSEIYTIANQRAIDIFNKIDFSLDPKLGEQFNNIWSFEDIWDYEVVKRNVKLTSLNKK